MIFLEILCMHPTLNYFSFNSIRTTQPLSIDLTFYVKLWMLVTDFSRQACNRQPITPAAVEEVSERTGKRPAQWRQRCQLIPFYCHESVMAIQSSCCCVKWTRVPFIYIPRRSQRLQHLHDVWRCVEMIRNTHIFHIIDAIDTKIQFRSTSWVI